MANNIHNVKNAEEFDNKLKELTDKFVLVDFWAEWCGPCKAAEPVIERLAEGLEEQLEVVKVDVDNNRELAERYGIMSIPTMYLYASQKAVAENEEKEDDEKGVIFAEDEHTERKFSVAVGFRPEPMMLQWMQAVGVDTDKMAEAA